MSCYIRFSDATGKVDILGQFLRGGELAVHYGYRYVWILLCGCACEVVLSAQLIGNRPRFLGCCLFAHIIFIFSKHIYRCATATLLLPNGSLTFAQRQGYPCAAVNSFACYKSTKLFAILQLLRCEIILLIPLFQCINFAERNGVSDDNHIKNV